MKLLILLLPLVLISCSTQFRAYEGPQNSLRGKGGTKDVVDGIDVWKDGSPPKPFKIVGIIDDSRGGGVISMAFLDSSLASKAKAVGGDAVMTMEASSEVVGYSSSGTSFSTLNANGIQTNGLVTTNAIRRHYGKYIVLKYT